MLKGLLQIIAGVAIWHLAAGCSWSQTGRCLSGIRVSVIEEDGNVLTTHPDEEAHLPYELAKKAAEKLRDRFPYWNWTTNAKANAATDAKANLATFEIRAKLSWPPERAKISFHLECATVASAEWGTGWVDFYDLTKKPPLIPKGIALWAEYFAGALHRLTEGAYREKEVDPETLKKKLIIIPISSQVAWPPPDPPGDTTAIGVPWPQTDTPYGSEFEIHDEPQSVIIESYPVEPRTYKNLKAAVAVRLGTLTRAGTPFSFLNYEGRRDLHPNIVYWKPRGKEAGN